MDQVRRFLEGTDRVGITVPSKAVCYDWVRRTLIRFHYLTLGRSERGVLFRNLCRVSGYSRSQVNRMVRQYRETGAIERRHCTTNGLAPKYTRDDIRLLVELDELHGVLLRPATKKLCESAYHLFGRDCQVLCVNGWVDH